MAAAKSNVDSAPRFPATLRYRLSNDVANPTATCTGGAVAGSGGGGSSGLLQSTLGVMAPAISVIRITWLAVIAATSFRPWKKHTASAALLTGSTCALWEGPMVYKLKGQAPTIHWPSSLTARAVGSEPVKEKSISLTIGVVDRVLSN